MIFRTVVVLAGIAGLIGSAEFVGTSRVAVPTTPRRNGGVPFRVGERLSYQAKVNFLNAGTATMSVEGIEPIRGRPTYHTVFDVRGRVLMFHVDDHYESWFDTTSLVSLRHVQHIDESMLRRMRRETSRTHIETLIAKLRSGIPGVALRTTFIVGFPGETETEFETLLDFIERTRFERLGIFKYSREEGSRAAKMPGQIPAKLKNERHRRAMTLQQKIAHEYAAAKIGTELKLLVDQPLVARTEADAPEVDTRVLLSQRGPVGEFIIREIQGARGYDLLA